MYQVYSTYKLTNPFLSGDKIAFNTDELKENAKENYHYEDLITFKQMAGL
jgi:ASC-1-like (ASCH) protein